MSSIEKQKGNDNNVENENNKILQEEMLQKELKIADNILKNFKEKYWENSEEYQNILKEYNKIHDNYNKAKNDDLKISREELEKILEEITNFENLNSSDTNKLEKFFEEKQKLPYLSKEINDKLDKLKDKIQKLFQKYPDFKKGIIKFVEEELDYTDYILSYYEKTELLSQEEKKEVIIQVLNGSLESHFYSIWEMENAIKYIQSNTYIDNKSQFLNDLLIHTPKTIYDLWEKMDAISQLSFYHKEEWYEYSSKNYCTVEDIYLFNLLELNINKLQKLDSYIKNWDDKGFMNCINDLFSIEERNNLLRYPEIRNKYIELRRWDLNIPKDTISDDIIMHLSKLKDKNIVVEFQKFISVFFNTPEKDKKNKILSEFINIELWSILEKSKYLSDNYKIIEIVENLITNESLNIQEWTSEYEEMEKLYNTVDDKITKIKKDTENYITKIKKNIENYITKQKHLNSKEYMESVKILQEISKIKNVSDVKNSDLYKLTLLLEDASAKEESWEVTKTTNSTESIKEGKEFAKISESKRKEMQQKIDILWLNAKVNDDWKIVWKNWEEKFSQKIQNWKIEVWADNKMIYTTSLWYKFEFENNEIWSMKIVEITEKFNYLNKIWLWYFGENFKKMLELIPVYLPNAGLNLSINEKSWNFLSNDELFLIIIPIFQNIWFLEKKNFSQNISEVQETTDLQMMTRIFKIKNWSAFIDWKFDAKIFWELLQSKNKV